jgi:hypothetical protein
VGTWALNAQGFTGDLEVIDKLIAEVAAILGKPEYGTGASMMSGDSIWRPHFHKPVDSEDSPPAAPTPGPDDGGENPGKADSPAGKEPPPTRGAKSGKGS